MTQIVSETRERFIAAIAEQVAADRIAEIHFFKPIKQGGLESGVAVIALTKDVAPVAARGTEDQPEPSSPPRHTVFTAHYRHTLKGVDRGKWQVTVVEEADAPLLTVEAVVRGVQRRAGDLDDPERMDGDTFREILAASVARSST
jgi:hypothetical protein